jgi:hypothetical protein
MKYLSNLVFSETIQFEIENIFLLSKDKFSYTNNFLYTLQAARNNPLMFNDSENFFILCEAREFNKEWMIVSPLGQNVYKKIFEVCIYWYKQKKREILIKKVDSILRNKLISLSPNFKEINLSIYKNKIDLSILPDDIFPECILDVERIFDLNISYLKNGLEIFFVKIENLRSKYHSFINRYNTIKVFDFKNSIALNKIDGLFQIWISDFKERMKKIGLNAPEDLDYYYEPYKNMINYVIAHNEKFFSYLIEIDNKLIGAAIYGKTGKQSCGQYLIIADNLGYKYSSEFTVLFSIQELKKKGIKWINCGGSELKGLYEFHKRFHPIERKMHYLVYSP